MNVTIRPEISVDFASVAEVHRLAFGRDDEARLVTQLREEGYARLSLVAELEGNIVGHVLFSALRIVGCAGLSDALALAPLAVIPRMQRHGIGGQLVRFGLAAAQQEGHRVVVVLGDPHYYGRFGFDAAYARCFDSPYAGESLMATELVPGALGSAVGRLEYPRPFSEL